MSQELPFLSPAELAAAGRELPAQFVSCLTVTASSPALHDAAAADGRVGLECREILRLLPGRRLVARVQVAGRPAVIKLFLGRGADRYRAREARGCAWMAAAGVATPALLGELAETSGSRAGAAHALLFEYIAGACPVHADDDRGVAAAAGQLALLHRAGCRYRDLHLDNFLKGPDTRGVVVIDGDGVRRSAGSTPLDERRSVEDLAVLCAQRPPVADARLAMVYRAYASGRGWPGDDSARLSALAAATRRQRHLRLRRYLKKAQRDCSEYLHQRSWRRWVVAVREAWNDALADFAADPDAAFSGARILKAGNSATVIRARLGERTYVIKRYNLKGPWHALRRALKPTARFRRAWLNGQRLQFLDIPTARPLALVERRFGPLRGVAYLVMEDLGDRDLGIEVAVGGLTEVRLAQVAALFRALGAAGLTHGDTKASNFLVTADGVAVIDLDAMHSSVNKSLVNKRSVNKSSVSEHPDLTRFLANFDHLPDVRARVRAALSGAGTDDGFAAPSRSL